MTGTVAFVVEGESDRIFWEKLLNRLFPRWVGRIVVKPAGDREQLIAKAWHFVNGHRSRGYAGTVFVLDLDKDACVVDIVERFPAEVIAGVDNGDVAICIAVRCLETWMLADPSAVNEVYVGAEYSVPVDLEGVGAATQFHRLAERCPTSGIGRSAKIARAHKIASRYDPDRAHGHSKSLDRAWRIISERLA